MRSLLVLLLGLCLSSCCTLAPEPEDVPTPARELRVMTFNIRYGTAQDGEHSWPARRELVAERIRAAAPDVLALQEALAFQLDELSEVLLGYEKIGQHREGGQGGEFSGLYVREELVLLASGEFWFSETPEVPGSKSWDSSLPRMTAWVDVAWGAEQRSVRIYGTHYDHRGAEARRRSSELILAHAAGSPRVIVMGDLNAVEAAAPVKSFLDAGYRSAVLELDPEVTRGTFSGFRDELGGNRRIDHVLFHGALGAEQAHILGGRVGELFPSDHDAVLASFSARD